MLYRKGFQGRAGKSTVINYRCLPRVWEKGWSCVSHIFAVLVLVLYGKGFKNPLTSSIKAGVASRASLAAGSGSCSKRGRKRHLEVVQKKILQLNKHELRAYSVSGTKDPEPSQTSSLPCLSVGVICGCLNLVNYTRTCFLGEGEAPKGRDGVLRQ